MLAAARARARALATGDEAALRALLHPDFRWTSHRGDRFDRESYVRANCGGPTTWHGQDLRDPRIVVVADTAVLTCTVVDQVDTGTYTMPMTQTWVRTDGRWRLLAGHAGPRQD